MKRYVLTMAAGLLMMPVAAQETYENAKLVGTDLNGTARYVGMGGAMEALGADISTIGTNPAGIGMFRKSSANISLGMVTQEEGKAFGTGHKTNMSFDQLGFVWSSRTAPTSYINFAFNFHKSKNFDYILSAADNLYNASQNKLTYIKTREGLTVDLNANGVPQSWNNSMVTCNQLDYIYARGINYDGVDDDGVGKWYYDNATSYTMDRSHTGYIGQYDFNLSGNINNRVYLGMTVGVYGVHYNHYSEYVEYFDGLAPIKVEDNRKVTGSGADVKLGIIFRPVETSPFRIGLSLATPTFYELTTRNDTYLSDMGPGGGTDHSGEAYDFKLFTPWKFGASLGHTIGNNIALGASYEYADYGSTDSRYITSRSNRDWADDESSSDDPMNRHTAQTLKAVHTLKLGAEFKPDPALAVRLGYNYVSPMYETTGFKDGSIDSYGSYYSSATDYTNWGATNRITCGLGYQMDNVNLSLAYQYSTQKGKFSPFMSWVDKYDAADDNIADEVTVNNKRHQLLLTATVSF